jgi:hypothetical protein
MLTQSQSPNPAVGQLLSTSKTEVIGISVQGNDWVVPGIALILASHPQGEFDK